MSPKNWTIKMKKGGHRQVNINILYRIVTKIE